MLTNSVRSCLLCSGIFRTLCKSLKNMGYT
jgi:hypothetical protein